MMKKELLTAFCTLLFSMPLLDGSEIVGGPNGGRLLELPDARVEFVVTEERLAKVVFFDAEMNAISPDSATIKLTAELPSGRQKIALAENETGFLSEAPLPEGETYRIVLQVRSSPEARPKNFRIDLNLEHCSGCDRGEYACTCGH